MNLPEDHATRIARAQLSLEGVATGDAFGERFFVNPGVVDSLIAHRTMPKEPWGYTDDTIMAISIVEVLGQHGCIDQDALAGAFAQRYQADPARGYGPAAHRILGEIGRGESWEFIAGAAFSGQGSLGNGGAMRVSPVGAYFADDLDRVVHEARPNAFP